MTSFNDGIEAAANHIRRQLKHAAPDQRVILSGLVYEIEALKRPEPSEEDKALKLARYLWERNGLEEWDDDPDYWMDYAFDALKATEAGGTDNDK